MQKHLVALVATVLLLILASSAVAAATQVDVRIEGETDTLFEGPILTDGHNVKGISDSQWHRCNGLNNGSNPVARPTPTAAAVDAMRIIDEPFDGNWYTQYDDYFITQWGPDRQDELDSEYWGIVVNNVFTNLGGCQYELDGGDEVLWIYDAFGGRERLLLYPGDYSGGPVPLTATATLNQPFEVEVDSWPGYSEGDPPASPLRSTTPYEGAEVGPVTTAASGFQKVEVASPDTVTTAPDGTATITFTTPGWHRIKATDFAAGVESVIRSNRLDVCVPQPPASDCGALPADAQVRMPPPPVPGEVDQSEEEDPDPGSPGGGGGSASPPGDSPPPPPASAARLRVALEALDRSRLASGIVGVKWAVTDAGPGVAGWKIATKTLGRIGARFVTRAGGKAKSAAQVWLPRGGTYKLKITFTDVLGRESTAQLGKVRVPKP
jgi:hypothetical protein